MIAKDLLIQCALEELGPEAELEVEGHILSCGHCAGVYASFARLGGEIAAFVRAGSSVMQVTSALAERVEREGLVTRRYILSPGAIVPCTVGAEDIYALTTLQADLSEATRVDLVRGNERIEDIPFDRNGIVRLLTSADLLRRFPTVKLPLRLIAVDAAGRERLIAEYTLDHTAFAP